MQSNRRPSDWWATAQPTEPQSQDVKNLQIISWKQHRLQEVTCTSNYFIKDQYWLSSLHTGCQCLTTEIILSDYLPGLEVSLHTDTLSANNLEQSQVEKKSDGC